MAQAPEVANSRPTAVVMCSSATSSVLDARSSNKLPHCYSQRNQRAVARAPMTNQTNNTAHAAASRVP